jgi:hypothetical protein
MRNFLYSRITILFLGIILGFGLIVIVIGENMFSFGRFFFYGIVAGYLIFLFQDVFSSYFKYKTRIDLIYNNLLKYKSIINNIYTNIKKVLINKNNRILLHLGLSLLFLIIFICILLFQGIQPLYYFEQPLATVAIISLVLLLSFLFISLIGTIKAQKKNKNKTMLVIALLVYSFGIFGIMLSSFTEEGILWEDIFTTFFNIGLAATIAISQDK